VSAAFMICVHDFLCGKFRWKSA